MSLLQKINDILAKYDDLKATFEGPSDSDKATEVDLAAFEEIVSLVQYYNKNAMAQCANVVGHNELGLPDEAEPSFQKASFVIGADAHGNVINVGDVVNHLSKPLVNGIVSSGVTKYKGEQAVLVSWGEGKITVSRLSKLVKA